MSRADLVLTPQGIRFMGRVIPCNIGRRGLTADKREGDGATPIGTHRLLGGYYRADRISGLPAWLKPIGPRDLWSDDVALPDYNQPVRAPYHGSHERLRRADPLYDLILVTDWNHPRTIAGKGSAIFLHVWRRPLAATAGCIAFAKSDLIWLVQRITLGTRLIVPPLPQMRYEGSSRLGI